MRTFSGDPFRLSIRRTCPTMFSAALGAAIVGLALPAAAQGTLVRANLGAAGTQANAPALTPRLSADGRCVVFASAATNLVPEDTNQSIDIFVADRWTGITTRESVAADGTQADDGSGTPAISADGRYVAFTSRASNLVPGEANGCFEVFVRDRQTGTIVLASRSAAGLAGNGDSYAPALSADGRCVVFQSLATNLVAGDTNAVLDVFVRDLVAGTIVRASLSSPGAQANAGSEHASISADGMQVVFASSATNLAPGITSGVGNVFLRDLGVGTTSCISVDPGGAEGDDWSAAPALSPDARYIVFRSWATNLVGGDGNGAADILLHDMITGSTVRAGLGAGGVQPNADCGDPAVSSDGRFVLFSSAATNLVAGDTNSAADVFLRDRTLGTTALVSLGLGGAPAQGDSQACTLTPDGRFVLFTSSAANLVGHDGNACADAFWLDRNGCAPVVASYCSASTSSNGCVATLSASGTPSASAGAGFVLQADQVEGQRLGLFYYGLSGPAAQPFGGGKGLLCVSSPLRRMTAQDSGGDAGQCNGQLSVDWNEYVATHPHALGVPFQGGEVVWVQAWYRDPDAPGGASLSNGMWFEVCR